MPLKIKKIFILFSLTIIIVIGGILSQHFFSIQAEVTEFPLSGWWWSENYGWLSLNSGNCNAEICNYSGAPVQYGAKISGNQISGWTWSEHVGWVSLGSSSTGTPPSGSKNLILSTTTGKITGWAKISTLGDNGWIKFDSTGTSYVPSGTFLPVCNSCTLNFRILTDENGDPILDGDGNPVRISTNDYTCKTCFTSTTPSTMGGRGAMCFGTFSSTTLNTSNGKYQTTSTVAMNCQRFGAGSDIEGTGAEAKGGKLIGWVWGGHGTWQSQTNSPAGPGWYNLNPAKGGSQIVYPWLQTEYGSVYSLANVRQKALSTANATYCFFANEIYNVSSSQCNEQVIKGIQIAYPKAGSSNTFKSLDLRGATTTVTSTGSFNKYGQKVKTINNQADISSILDDTIYYAAGDLTISSALTIDNGGLTTRGNGLIIVNGDLTINGNITYAGASGITDVKKLASVGWIVLGDVKVNQNVTNLAGAFILLGNQNISGCQVLAGSDINYPKYAQNKCGAFFSGNSSNPLTVYGLIVAKAFDFERTYTDVNQGSERIIYDGRWLANPPTGLKSFVEKLPLVTDFIYGQ